jgi:hypothetical protein
MSKSSELSKSVTVQCKQKHYALDGKPYRLEVWTKSSFTFGVAYVQPTLPIYMTSFSTLTECEAAKEMVTDFFVRFRELKNSK